MGGYGMRLRAPAPGPAPGVVSPVPDVTLRRPSLLGPEEGSATLDGFATDSAALTQRHRRRLATLAVTLNRLLAEPPGGRIQAVGHTDLVGSEAHNDALGQQRAEAVRDELVQQGVPASDIHTHSLGESVPAIDTPNADPRNRRVEVYFAPNSGLGLAGTLTEPLTRPEPLRATPPPEIPGVITRPDYCTVFPEACRPPSPEQAPPDLYAPVPELPERRLPSLSEAIWRPVDRALEHGLRDLGIPDEWNRRLRDAARAGAARGATELLNQTMDAAHLTGETRQAVDAALRAAVQLEVPFR